MQKPAVERAESAMADVGIDGRERVQAAPQALVRSDGNRLTTFVPPRPNGLLISACTAVNRVFCLGGIPGLRQVPLLNLIPGVQGITKIETIDLPASDEARLSAAVNPSTAAFITPNHPEFFTDWMIDKEISARVAPRMASWATHGVVNGMGALMQRFWLANNLIAQIPGAGGAAGKEYSVAWALAGHGVLLHSEGHVGWHNDYVASLFPGALDMAIEAARRAAEKGESRPVFVAPIVWKLSFKKDETRGLAKELDYIEHRLGLPKRSGDDLGQRLYAIHNELLEKDAAKAGVHLDKGAGYFQNQARVLDAITNKIRILVGENAFSTTTGEAIEDMRATATIATRLMRKDPPAGVDKKLVSSLLRTGQRLLRLTPAMYRNDYLTQEQVAESCKRLRSDYCTGTLRDAVSKFVPRPVGPRVAHLRVPEPFEVSSVWREAVADESMRDEILQTIRERMQTALDGINRDYAPVGPTVANPFMRRARLAAA